jgi:divalent metal cation (Fe/Co/Zn/Cd) transporter
MDGVEPVIRDESEAVLAEFQVWREWGVRVHWIGLRPHAEAEISVDERRTMAEPHDIAKSARHALLHEILQLASAIIHADRCAHSGRDPHAEMAHHGAI